MNLYFNYCAVKYMAFRCGFNEDDSQRIAEYCQLVDDSIYDTAVIVDKSGIPDDIMERELYEIEDNQYCVYLPQTAALAREDAKSEDEWHKLLSDPILGEYVLTPFHYCPAAPVSEAELFVEGRPAESENVLAEAIRNPQSHAIFGRLMELAKNTRRSDKTDRTEFLIWAGVLCHILADSFSHDLFSGVLHKMNQVRIREVRDCCVKQDITSNYMSEKESQEVPAVGHYQVGNVVEDNGIMGTLLRAGQYGYTFDNEQKVANAVKRVMQVLFAIQDIEVDRARETLIENTVEIVKKTLGAEALRTVKKESVSKGYEEWKNKTNMTYQYSKEEVLGRLQGHGETSDLHELYRFIIVADDVQRQVLADYETVEMQ